MLVFFFFKQKTAYEMLISDWSSDVCSSNLPARSNRIGKLTLCESLERRVRSIHGPTGEEAIRYALLEDGRWQRMPRYEKPVLPRSPIDWAEPSNEARYLNGIIGMAGVLDQATSFLLHPFMHRVFAALGGAAGLPDEIGRASCRERGCKSV